MQSIVLIGKESSGKSRLASSLTKHPPRSANFRGSTVYCAVYPAEGLLIVDTPGILLQSDSLTTPMATAEVRKGDQVFLVIKATQIDDDLIDLLP